MTKDKRYFVSQLLDWNKAENTRLMPWKGEKDPYRIWLSEIILQQTRVEQGREYYNRFVRNFPTVLHLSRAPETEVYKLWEGLGYYSRCKNLIVTAGIISKQFGGKFPVHYEEILALKGIGPYTAAAIASFAFNLPHAVLDGNVFRVLSRFFGINTAIDSIAGKKYFSALANELLDKKEPGIYNQAIMDFGAIVCKPKAPSCAICPLKTACAAYLAGTAHKLPVKEKSIINKNRWFYYLVIEYGGKVYLNKRKGKDIWENLYEFVLAERSTELPASKKNSHALVKKTLGDIPFTIISVSKPKHQQLTHQTIRGYFIRVSVTMALKIPGHKAYSADQLADLPFPKFIAEFLAENDGLQLR
jgi:A/G-specific adenine glycosylase